MSPHLGARPGVGAWRRTPGGHGDMDCHLVGGKSLSPTVFSRYRSTSRHSLCSGTQLLERGWALFYSGVVHTERPHVLKFSPVNDRVASPRVLVGDRSHCCFGLWAKRQCRALGLFRGIGSGAGSRRHHHSAGRLQHSCGQ